MLFSFLQLGVFYIKRLPVFNTVGYENIAKKKLMQLIAKLFISFCNSSYF